jgi:hypothetical protein
MSIAWETFERPQQVAKVVVVTFSSAGCLLLCWAVVEISHFKMSRVTEFDMMIMLITLLMFGNNITAMSTVNLFPTPPDPSAVDDMFNA